MATQNTSPFIPLHLEGQTLPVTGTAFNIYLWLNQATRFVTGVVEIIPEDGGGHVIYVNVKGGYYYPVGNGQYRITVAGEFFPYNPPILIMEHFSATMLLDKQFNGKGEFHWGRNLGEVILKRVVIAN